MLQINYTDSAAHASYLMGPFLAGVDIPASRFIIENLISGSMTIQECLWVIHGIRI